MSVQQLRFDDRDKIFKITHDKDKFKIMIFGLFAIGVELDRSQAHLLMLYLQEHLKK
jgi:hypothetical protein